VASVIDDPNGRKRIQFVASDGKRKTIRLGKMSAKQAESFKGKTEALVGQTITGALDDEASRWLIGLNDTMHERLAAVGLVKPRKFSMMTLGAFVDAYIADRTDAKPQTLINLKQARKDLVGFFGADRPLREITEGDADEFWRYLKRRGLSDNTARRICGRAKQFFRAAIRKRMIQANPFADLKCHVQSNQERYFTVTRDMLDKLLDACPDDQWKLLIVLTRIGGLRCSSECLALRWGDVDWDRNRITVHSPKTEHIEGRQSRVIPLFPDLRPFLLKAFDQAEPGTEHVITRYRNANSNLRTQFGRIIQRAGLQPWPQLFHNMRRSRQNELERTFGQAVACAWIGNSESVARQHYFHATDADFDRATDTPKTSPASELMAAQNQAQSAAVTAGTGRDEPSCQNQNRPDIPVDSDKCQSVLHLELPPRGVEHERNYPTKSAYYTGRRHRIRHTCRKSSCNPSLHHRRMADIARFGQGRDLHDHTAGQQSGSVRTPEGIGEFDCRCLRIRLDARSGALIAGTAIGVSDSPKVRC